MLGYLPENIKTKSNTIFVLLSNVLWVSRIWHILFHTDVNDVNELIILLCVKKFF